MNTLVLVGGASASGKSIFVDLLQQQIEGVYSYRRVQAFWDCAKSQNIEISKTFDYISQEMADDWFFKVCNCNKFVVSDVHFVVQLKKDSQMISENIIRNTNEKYIPTISERLIEKLKESDIQIVCVLISASPSVILERSKIRNEKKQRELRYESLDEVVEEQKAEKEHWRNIISGENILSINIDSELNSPQEMVNIFVDFLQLVFKEKQIEGKKALIKRRKI